MRKVIGFIYDNRDWFSLLSAVILSITLLNTNDSPNIQIIRGKANSAFAVFFTPANWLKDIGALKNENINLKDALSKGADRGIFLRDDEFKNLDILSLGKVFQYALKNEKFVLT